MRTAPIVLALVLAKLLVTGEQLAAQAPAPEQPSTPPSIGLADPVAGRVLTVQEAVAIALEHQPQILARLGDYAAARLRVAQVLSPLLPQLATTTSTSRSSTTILFTSPQLGGATVPVTSTRDFPETLDIRVSMSQLFFDFGKTFASADVQRALAAVTREDVELQRQLITQAVKEAFTNVNFGKRLIQVNLEALARAELSLRSARGFFDVGARPKSDVARAEVDVANARVDVIRARGAERLARVALNTAMGLAADTPTQITDNLEYVPLVLDAATLHREALGRPEYRQARLQVEAAEASIRRAFRDFFPDVVGNANYGGFRTELFEVWSATLTFNWTFFDGGNRIARYRETKAQHEAATARVQAIALDIAREVEQAYINAREAEERIGAARILVESARENFRLARGRFEAGVGTVLEVTDAQLELTRAENVEVQARADYQLALAQLDRAVGRR